MKSALSKLLALFAMLTLVSHLGASQQAATFKWPEGKKAALSLTWDDARLSQPDAGAAILDRHGIKATFFVVPSAVERRLDGWRKVAAAGHEIANHSVNHPCSGNFPWARRYALEEYTLDRMRAELQEANRRTYALLGVMPETFAYPCGQKFVGRGKETKSYVPIIAADFLAGRGWLDEAPNDPSYCDLAQLTGVEMDGKDFKQILPLLEDAVKNGSWLVLAGHEIAKDGRQTTRTEMLEKLLTYLRKPESEIWTAPMGTVARYIRDNRPAPSRN